MPTLRIALVDGFEGEPVEVRVNGRVTLTGRPRTQLLTGLADSADVEVALPQAQVSVSLPSRGISEEIAVPIAGDASLALSLEGPALVHRSQAGLIGFA